MYSSKRKHHSSKKHQRGGRFYNNVGLLGSYKHGHEGIIKGQPQINSNYEYISPEFGSDLYVSDYFFHDDDHKKYVVNQIKKHANWYATNVYNSTEDKSLATFEANELF